MNEEKSRKKDFQDLVIEEFLYPNEILPTESRCKGCKFYKEKYCRKQKYNNIAPFIGIYNCWMDCSLKEKIILMITSTVTIVN